MMKFMNDIIVTHWDLQATWLVTNPQWNAYSISQKDIQIHIPSDKNIFIPIATSTFSLNGWSARIAKYNIVTSPCACMEPHIPGKSTILTTGAILVMWNDRKHTQILYLTAWNALRYCCHSSGHTSHHSSWWRHRMETFSALLAICAGNSPVTGEFPAQRPVTRSFDVFFDLRLNKRLRKQSRRWWWDAIAPIMTPL